MLNSVARISFVTTAVTLVVVAAAVSAFGGTPRECLAWAVIVTLALRILPILASFPIAYWPRGGYRAPALGAVRLARTVCREVWAMVRLFFFYHLFERWIGRLEPARVVDGEMPVVLVHGFFANSGFWHRMKASLRAAQWHNLFALNLEPPFTDIDEYARQLEQRIEYACRCSASDSVVLVAHSMGGLVARAYALRRPERVHAMICLGTPHAGTLLAVLAPWENARQMRPGSAWLEALNAAVPPVVPITNLYSEHDNIIVPQCHAALDGTRNVSLTGLGHLDMAFSPVMRRALRNALDEVRPAASAAPPAGTGASTCTVS